MSGLMGGGVYPYCARRAARLSFGQFFIALRIFDMSDEAVRHNLVT
jgi:hypothetical protein